MPRTADKAFKVFLDQVADDPEREGLLETPARVAAAWYEWTAGYAQKPEEVLKAFSDGAEKYDELVLVSNIPVYSTCEHHMATIWGLAHIGYIPRDKVVGLSKFNRLVDVYARRLQVQERLTVQVADAICSILNPIGVGVVLQCRHMCMESRGVKARGTITTTSALRGALKSNADARAEFLDLVKIGSNGMTI